MKLHRSCYLIIAVLGFSSMPALGQPSSENPTPAMDQYITLGQFEEAYNLGLENLEEWEGEDSAFDFVFGLAALEFGKANEAVYALQRVTTSAPDRILRDRARLELARAYFLSNNLGASENLFNEVLASNPPANVQQNIQAFLQLIETRRDQLSPSFNFSVSSALGSDDNINSAVSDGLIDTPLIGQIELSQDGQETDDYFSSSILTANYTYPFDRNRSLEFRMSLNHLDNLDTDQFDIDTLRGQASYTWGSQVNRFRHGISFHKVNLDQNGFQDSVALNSSWQHVGSNGWYQSIAASYSWLRFDTTNGGASNALRDVDQILLNGSLTKITNTMTHTFNLYTARESSQASAAGEHNGRSFHGIAYSLMYRPNQVHTPYLRVSLQDVKHADNHPVFFNDTRADTTKSMTLGWYWYFTPDLRFTAETNYSDNDTNVPLFEYSRLKYQAGFRYQF